MTRGAEPTAAPDGATPRRPELEDVFACSRCKLAANPVTVDRACHVVTFSFAPSGGGIERKVDRNTSAGPTHGSGGEFLLNGCRHVRGSPRALYRTDPQTRGIKTIM